MDVLRVYLYPHILLHGLSNGGWILHILSVDCAKATISVNSIQRGQENDATDHNYDLPPPLQTLPRHPFLAIKEMKNEPK